MDNSRVVKQEIIEVEGESYQVSTVDLVLDHSFGEGPPLYYETMVFLKGSYADMYQERYSTKQEAQKSHDSLVSDLKEGKYHLVNEYFELKNS